MKKFYLQRHFPSGKWRKIYLVMRPLLILLLCCISSAYANQSFSQQPKLNVNYNDQAIVSVLDDLKARTGYSFVYHVDLIPRTSTVSVALDDASLDAVLDEVLVKNGFGYSIEGKVVVVNRNGRAQQPQQAQQIKISGMVVDDGRVPMAGVTVLVVGSTVGVATDSNGAFTISARVGDMLVFSFIGYQNVSIPVTAESKDLVVVLKQESVAIQDVVVTAFGEQQSRESLIGSVTSVNAEQLRSSNSDLTASFAGNIAGMIAWQTGGIPGALTEEEMNTKFYIRGVTSFQSDANIDPLILLDGIETSKLDLARIDPEDIESFSVLKDASATAMYGARGANGVIYVTTKRGQSGSVYTSARYEVITSMPTSDIDVIDPVSYMKLYNETVLGRNPSSVPKYTRQQIENTMNPDIPDFVYPANDWYKMMFKPMSVNHHMGLNIRGGSDVVQYYASLNYNADNGMLKTDRLNQFKVNIQNQGMTLRVNLNIDLTKKIKLVVNSFSTYDKYHGPMSDVTQAYYMAFRASPVDFPAIYPADDYYKWNHIRFGGSTTSYNPYAELHKGYNDRMRYSTMNRVEYIHNLDFITPGLELRANASLAQEGTFATAFETVPYYYTLGDYDFTTGKHTLIQVQEGSRVLGSSPASSSSIARTQMGFDVRGMYNRSWDDHRISSTVLFNVLENRTAMPGTLFSSFPQRNLSLAGRVSYGYKDRYWIEGAFGYNGSERFAKEHRMGFFPAIGGAWIVSSEPFMASLQETIPFLKLRLSWGKVGNDGIINDPRFAHLSSIIQDMMNPGFRPGTAADYVYIIENYANSKVTWEVGEQYNLGVDFKLLRGIVEVNADFYKQIRHNVLDYRTAIPSSLGLTRPALDNVGKAESQGMEVALKVQHAFSRDFWMILNGTFTYSRAKYLDIQEASNKPAWQMKKGMEISQAIGYIAEGLFQDQAEIDNSPFQGGNVMPGDIRYRDINADGKIDAFDAVPIGYPETPRIIYGFNAFLNYKKFEFSFAFQGMGHRSFFINPQTISPFDNNNAVLQKIADDHWSPQNASNKPFWPRMSTANIIQHNPQEDYNANIETRKSTYFMYDGAFIRCRSIELGYNLPQSFVNNIGLRSVKIFARTNNPFIISSFKVWDIELGSSGFNYPIQRTWSAGINVTF